MSRSVEQGNENVAFLFILRNNQDLGFKFAGIGIQINNFHRDVQIIQKGDDLQLEENNHTILKEKKQWKTTILVIIWMIYLISLPVDGFDFLGAEQINCPSIVDVIFVEDGVGLERTGGQKSHVHDQGIWDHFVTKHHFSKEKS